MMRVSWVGWVAEWGDFLVNHPKWGLTKVG
jgi:hypothetical protein